MFLDFFFLKHREHIGDYYKYLFYLFHKPFHWPSEGVSQAKIELNLKGKGLKSEQSSFFCLFLNSNSSKLSNILLFLIYGYGDLKLTCISFSNVCSIIEQISSLFFMYYPWYQMSVGYRAIWELFQG